MKKIISALLLVLFLVPMGRTEALFGGGISGPMPVFNIDKTVDAATLATQINTLNQLEASLKNLSTMDASAAASNSEYIYDAINNLISLQDSMNLGMNQAAYDQKYMDVTNMTPTEQADYLATLLYNQNRTLQSAMEVQGLVTNANATNAQAIQRLLSASKSSQGALAAAQVGHQLAALQISQLVQMQDMIARSERAKAERMAYEREQEEMEHNAAKEFFQKPTEPKRGQGAGFPEFK